MAQVSYEIKCCPKGGHYKHWYPRRGNGFSLGEAKLKQEDLLKKSHESVTLLKVVRSAVSISQPRRDAGAFCRKRLFGRSCELDHQHYKESGNG